VRSSFGPVPGAAIAAFPSAGSLPALLRVPADAGGEFSVRLPPGTRDVTLAVAAPGYAFRMLRLLPNGDDPVEVAVDQHGGSLTIETAPSDGALRPYLVHDGAIVAASAASYFSGARMMDDPSKRLHFQMETEAGGYSLCWLADAEVRAAIAGALPAERCVSGLLSRQGSLALKAK